MKLLKNMVFPNERDLYGIEDTTVMECKFDGDADGESALKECKNIELISCYMNLRYPLWHDDNVSLQKTTMSENCRAALWYSNKILLDNCEIKGVKAVRECSDVIVKNSSISSSEFGWKSNSISMENSKLEGEYFLFLSKNIDLKNIDFKGKYSFQYVSDVTITDSYLDTKDAFWHAKNVVVKNCVVKGEYLAWYSENIEFINCKIIGTQPLCYCKNLKLIDCEMIDTDLSFEYSIVDATIKGEILSIKNPLSGKIIVDKANEVLITEDSKYKCECEIIVKG